MFSSFLQGDYTFQHADTDFPGSSRRRYREAPRGTGAISAHRPRSLHFGILENLADSDLLETSWSVGRSLHGGHFSFGEFLSVPSLFQRQQVVLKTTYVFTINFPLHYRALISVLLTSSFLRY